MGFIVPFVNHIGLFFFFAFNLFYSFTFLLFGRHALRVGSVERPARNHLCAPFSCRSMKTVSQVIPGEKQFVNCGRRKTNSRTKKEFFLRSGGNRENKTLRKNLHSHFASFISVLVFSSQEKKKCNGSDCEGDILSGRGRRTF